MRGAYYNEFDHHAAAWLRELIKCGLIAPGDVDERDIRLVEPEDVRAYTQVHLFAGIGGWSYALRLAGWPDDRRVWTGSCPCQPFSGAGQQKGEADERHLWPWMHHLVEVERPSDLLGEQVASKLGREWLAGVRADLEELGYAVGAADLCAAGVSAPHIRQRLFWVAHAAGASGPEHEHHARERARSQSDHAADGGGIAGGLDDPNGQRLSQRSQPDGRTFEQQQPSRRADLERSGDLVRLGHSIEPGLEGHPGNGDDGHQPRRLITHPTGSTATTGPARIWDGFDLIHCRDGKARRIESGTFPLAHGVPFRVGRLRGYGNAIVPQVAAEFIRAYLETIS